MRVARSDLDESPWHLSRLWGSRLATRPHVRGPQKSASPTRAGAGETVLVAHCGSVKFQRSGPMRQMSPTSGRVRRIWAGSGGLRPVRPNLADFDPTRQGRFCPIVPDCRLRVGRIGPALRRSLGCDCAYVAIQHGRRTDVQGDCVATHVRIDALLRSFVMRHPRWQVMCTAV